MLGEDYKEMLQLLSEEQVDFRYYQKPSSKDP
jgi:hypothetical protein